MRITLRRGAAAGVYGLGHGAPAFLCTRYEEAFSASRNQPRASSSHRARAAGSVVLQAMEKQFSAFSRYAEARSCTVNMEAISIGNHFHTAMSCRSEQVLARLCWQLVAIASHASTPSGASRVRPWVKMSCRGCLALSERRRRPVVFKPYLSAEPRSIDESLTPTT